MRRLQRETGNLILKGVFKSSSHKDSYGLVDLGCLESPFWQENSGVEKSVVNQTIYVKNMKKITVSETYCTIGMISNKLK